MFKTFQNWYSLIYFKWYSSFELTLSLSDNGYITNRLVLCQEMFNIFYKWYRWYVPFLVNGLYHAHTRENYFVCFCGSTSWKLIIVE